MSRMKSAMILTALAGMGAFQGLDTADKPTYELRGPKNKYNLTDEQIELMRDMTPKEKKKFLKSLTPQSGEG